MTDPQTLKRPFCFLNSKTITGTFILLLALFLLADLVINNSLFFQNPGHFTFKAKNGNFVCCDVNQSNVLFADRSQVGNWEQFSTGKTKEGYKKFITSEGYPISTDSFGNLKGMPGISSDKDFWKMEAKGDSVLIHNKAGKYWRLGGLRVVTGPRSSADAFFLTDLKKPIPFADYFLIIAGFFLIIMAVVLFQVQERPMISLLILMGAAFLLALYSIRVFDFLLIWDEQYHALVAKNLIHHPFKPMLYIDPILNYNYKHWLGNHIWLHKQPLFLWQMAVSIWIFGAKAWAARVPDLIMTVLLVPVIYRMGSIAADKRTGYWAAVFFTVSHFLFRLTTGSVFSDHNDVAFLFYVTVSIWSWLEYEMREGRNGRMKFILLTGFFAGAAILVKWLPGLLVYAGWGLSILLSEKSRKEFRSYLDAGIAILVTIIVALPWQIYILLRFPTEARFEYSSSASHFLQVIEGHNGDGLGWHYYLDNFKEVFSVNLITWVLFAVIFILISKRKKLAISLLGMVVLVFIFFSVAVTKMPAFTFITLSMILLVFGSVFTLTEHVLSLFAPMRFLRIFLMTALILNIASQHYRLTEKYRQNYSLPGDNERCFSDRAKLAGLYREFSSIIPESNQSQYVIIHCPWEEIPQLMFYTNIRAAYDQVSVDDLKILASRKELKIGYFVISDEAVPLDIAADNSILKIRFSKPVLRKDLGKCLH